MPQWLATIMFKTGIADWMTKFFKYSKRSVSEVLEELTDNKDLQTVLAYNFGDYGMSLSKISQINISERTLLVIRKGGLIREDPYH